MPCLKAVNVNTQTSNLVTPNKLIAPECARSKKAIVPYLLATEVFCFKMKITYVCVMIIFLYRHFVNIRCFHLVCSFL